MRTVFWLELLLLPAGVVLLTFVIPTFQVVYASIGVAFPVVMGTYALAVTVGGYVFPVIALAALVQGWRWHARHGLSRMVYFSALFSISQDFWRDTDGRLLLRH